MGTVGGAFFHAINVRKLLPGVEIVRIAVRDPGLRRRTTVHAGGKASEERLDIGPEMFGTVDSMVAPGSPIERAR